MKQGKTIFSFWEPQGNMTPYLKLCIKTWERALPDYEIILLDYSNIGQYLPEATYNMTVLKKLSLMMQKDAIMVGVLKEHGGIFLDADTLVTEEISPLMRMLQYTESVMFDYHCAFLAARPGARLLTLWHKVIQERLNCLEQASDEMPHLQWDYLANNALVEAMDDLITSRSQLYRRQKKIEDQCVLVYLKITRDQKLLIPQLDKWMNRIGKALVNRKRALYFRIGLKQYLTMLNRLDNGFIPEASYFSSRLIPPDEKYRKFWFDNKIDVKNVFRSNQMLIGLHHSWTPQWYKELSEKEVLENDSLLSRTLKHIL